MPRPIAYLPAALLLAGSVLVSRAQRQQSPSLVRPLAQLPANVAGYRGVERPIDSASVAVAGMTSYIFRVYGRDSVNAFSLYVGYYDNQTTGRTIHSPRNCLPGAGWQVVQSEPVQVHGSTVNRYMLANGDAQALVYYWYQGRGRVAWNEYAVKWDLLRDAARRGRTEEALVRIVVPMIPGGKVGAEWAARVARADSLAQTVASSIIPAVDLALPPWVGTP
ncbi:MAG: hypothetical protein MNPFHGCM_02468 [Gemmatimonadaceae bacterium]|nr:hypothetical protein [Gemmatimonadaceae bacterium]